MITAITFRIALALCGLKTLPAWRDSRGLPVSAISPYSQHISIGTTGGFTIPTSRMINTMGWGTIATAGVMLITPEKGEPFIVSKREPRILLREDGKWIVRFK